MQKIFSNTTLTVNQLIEKIDTGEPGLESGRVNCLNKYVVGGKHYGK